MSDSCEKETVSAKLTQLEKQFGAELRKVKHEVDDLYETVYKGNGQPSLVTRVTGIEGKLRGLREQIDEKIAHIVTEHSLRFESIHQKLDSKFGRLEGWIETKLQSIEDTVKTSTENRKIDRSGSWQFKAALITAFTALIGTLLVVLFSK